MRGVFDNAFSSSKIMEEALLDSMNAFPMQQIVHSIVPIDEDNVAVTFQFREKQAESKAFDPRHVRFTMDPI